MHGDRWQTFTWDLKRDKKKYKQKFNHIVESGFRTKNINDGINQLPTEKKAEIWHIFMLIDRFNMESCLPLSRSSWNFIFFDDLLKANLIQVIAILEHFDHEILFGVQVYCG